MTPPLVLLDADVLGRERTGDETYVLNLLRRLPDAAGDTLRFAAVTRHPELVPEGVEAIALPARSQMLRMTVQLPRLLRRRAAGARALPARSAADVPVPRSRHRPRPLVRARPARHEPPRPHDLPHRRAALRPARRARVRSVGTDAQRPDRPLRHAAGEDRRHAERGRSCVHPRRRARRLPPRSWARSRSARTRSSPPTPHGRSGCRSSWPGPRRSPRSRGSSSGAAPSCAATWTGRSSQTSTAAPPASSFRRATKASACPCSRRWHAGRRWSRPTIPPLREVGGDAAVYAGPAGLAEAVRRALQESEARSRAGLERARLFSWDETARRAVAAYREVLAL